MAATKSSGVGFAGTAFTPRFNPSRRNADVVGPIVATRAGSKGRTTSAGNTEIGRSKTPRSVGIANSAEDGAKKTIHQVSKPEELSIRNRKREKKRRESTCGGFFHGTVQFPCEIWRAVRLVHLQTLQVEATTFKNDRKGVFVLVSGQIQQFCSGTALGSRQVVQYKMSEAFARS